MKKKKPVKKSGGRAASVAGRYLEMSFEDFYFGSPRQRYKDIKLLAASVLSQREKDGK